jgi:hypothetical protein
MANNPNYITSPGGLMLALFNFVILLKLHKCASPRKTIITACYLQNIGTR